MSARETPAERIARATRNVAVAVEQQRDAVIAGRAAGMTWMQLGAALGVTHQAARQRYGPLVGRRVA